MDVQTARRDAAVAARGDAAVAALAARQHGVVSRRQMLGIGMGRGSVELRLRSGRLHPVHRGVYAVGHAALTRKGRWMAAVLAAGATALLSHRSAAALWEIREQHRRSAIDISVISKTGGRRRDGLVFHRTSTMLSEDFAVRAGIPVTSPARTIIDQAAILGDRHLERMIDEAISRGILDERTLRRRFATARPCRGAPRLQAVLDRHSPGTTLTRSELEERFLSLCDSHGLPRPKVNTRIEGFAVDFLWPGAGLIVETDGRRYHELPGAFEGDRRRDVSLTVAGYRVLRFTYRQVQAEPDAVVGAVRAVLRSGGSAR